MPASSSFHRVVAPFGRLFDFAGRTRRSDYWPYMVLLFAIYVAGTILTMFGMFVGLGLSIGPAFAVTGLVGLLAFAATVRRLHDVGWSGWWAGMYLVLLLGFVAHSFYWRYVELPQLEPGERSSLYRFFPLLMTVNLAMWGLGVFILVLAVLDGTPGPNRYGADPKGRTRP